jgi:tryptophan synthase alpha chain
MTYLDPLLAFSPAELGREARRAGVDGLLVVDLSPLKAGYLMPLPEETPLDRIVMITPTTARARLPLILEHAGGFVYCVSMSGVTGAAGARVETAGRVVELVRQHSRLPALVGFGISSPEAAHEMARVSDGVIVGSALLAAIGTHRGSPAVEAAGTFLERMRAALDA